MPRVSSALRMRTQTRPRQLDRVRAQLHLDRADGHGSCGSTFLDMHIPRYGARIWELIHLEGCVIDSRPCTRHRHEGPVAEYVLIVDPRDTPTQLSFSVRRSNNDIWAPKGVA